MNRPNFLPNTILAGAPKSGSSSLYNRLGSHPDTLVAEPDNPGFFLRASRRDPLEFYRDFYPDPEGEDPPGVIVEGTVDYLYVPGCARRMREVLGPELKLLFLLRHPVERAVSEYWHRHKKFEDRRSLEEVFRFEASSRRELLEEEKKKIRDALESGDVDPNPPGTGPPDRLERHRYLRHSFYGDYLSDFTEVFPRSNVLVLLTEEWGKRPADVLREVEGFLGLDPHVPPDVNRRDNPTIVPRHDRLSSLVHRYLRPIAGALFPGEKPDLLNKLYHRFTYREKPSTPAWILERLGPFFASERQTLAGQYDLAVNEHWDLHGSTRPGDPSNA